MNKFFDEVKWSELISKPDWYMHIVPELIEIKKQLKPEDRETIKQYKKAVYTFFERHLNSGKIALGNEVGNWDTARKSIDTIIIHHTKGEPGLTPELLSAIELVRLYAMYYYNPYDGEDVKGKPISSGHVRDGKQVFYPYHWIIRGDGTPERLLEDQEVGWQAGNWEMNCRSVAIVLDNNYENSKPSEIEIESISKVITRYYSNVPKERILGHCEVKPATTCPGNLFLSTPGQKGWKEELLEKLG
jgi:hypothetical protein